MTETPQGVVEEVVLLDQDEAPIGTAAKSGVHDEHTPLHLAFSCYVFNPLGELLITRRALTKRTWPGVWTNSFCGHPTPGESFEDAVRRRADRELGLRLETVELELEHFRYRAVDASGIVENEVCPVFRAITRDQPVLRVDEVAEYHWAAAADVRASLTATPWVFSPWMRMQVPQMDAFDA